MARSIEDSINRLRESIALTADRLAQKDQLIAELKARNETLESDLASTREELRKALLDIDFLQLSHRLAADPDTLIKSRRHIARLIRTLDLSIAMLKEG